MSRNKAVSKDEMDEAGGATVRAVGIMIAVLLIAAMLLPALQVLSVRERAQAGVDLAALAAASALIDSVGASSQGDPCVRASTVAAANGLQLRACKVSGLDVTASAIASVPGLGLTFEVRSRAGPKNQRIARALLGAVSGEEFQERDRPDL